MRNRRSRQSIRALAMAGVAAALCVFLIFPVACSSPVSGVAAKAVAERKDEASARKTGVDDEQKDKEAAKPGGEEAEAKVVKLSPEQAARAGVTTAKAGPGRLAASIELLGEVRLNADRLAHVTPRVSGVISEVKKDLGSVVRAGEVLAVLESRELAAAKAAYLAAQGRAGLAQTTYEREKSLWEKKISAEQDYLAARQALDEAHIELSSAEQQLRALGLSKEGLRNLSAHSEDALTRYEIAAPIDGTIIEKRAVLGESIAADATTFIVADLRTVWADFSVRPQDIPSIHIGQSIRIVQKEGGPALEVKVAYVGPTVEQETRAALARALLPNDQGQWKPGQFVTGAAECEAEDVPLVVPKTAVQTIGGEPCVFVAAEEGYEACPVTLGRSDQEGVEVLKGLRAGQTYAAAGTFVLKAELEKSKAEEE